MLVVTPPLVIFDTMIFTDAASGALGKASQTAISPADWAKVINYVNRTYVHAATPATVVELLTSLGNADRKYFSEQCVRLRKLQQSFSNTIFLNWVRYFIRTEVFGLEANMDSEIEYNLRNVINLVLNSSSKETRSGRSDSRNLPRNGKLTETTGSASSQSSKAWTNQRKGNFA